MSLRETVEILRSKIIHSIKEVVEYRISRNGIGSLEDKKKLDRISGT